MNAKDLLTQSENGSAGEKDRKKFSLLFSLGVKNPYAVFPLPDSDSYYDPYADSYSDSDSNG